MPSIFVGKAGELAKINSVGWLNQANITFTTNEYGFISIAGTVTNIKPLFAEADNVLVQSFDGKESINSNIMYSCDNRIFVNVSGDKLGSASVSGSLFFKDVCNTGAVNKDPLGVIRDRYKDLRLVSKTIDAKIAGGGQMPIVNISTGGQQPYEMLVNALQSSMKDTTSKFLNFTMGGFLLPVK
jgi:hypothetical protein